MDEEISEALAQLRHENIRLHDELKHLKEQTLSTEENLNLVYLNLSKRESHIKSLEQQINGIHQTLKEKEQVIDSLEQSNENLRQLNQRLSTENCLFKENLTQEKSKSEQLDMLKTKEEEWKNAYAKIRQDNCLLLSELSVKSEEHSLCVSEVKNLQQRVKELEDERTELMTMRDILLIREKEERLKIPENMEWFLRKSPEWSKSQLSLIGQGDQDLAPGSFTKDSGNVNLREEILEVEVREKQNLIGQLETDLQKKEEETEEIKNLIKELKQKLGAVGLLDCESTLDLRLDSSAFLNIYNHLLKLMDWPEGQPGESKPLTEVSTLAVVVKDGVQTTQPGSIRVVETISIASQTDPIKNLSPVSSHFRAFEKYNPNNSPSDSDDEGGGGGGRGRPLLFIEENNLRKGLQMFSEHKNCDLDMDIYKMSKPSDSSVTDMETIGEGFSLELSEGSSDKDSSNNSKDVNLNSKKFADCNLVRTAATNNHEVHARIPGGGDGESLSKKSTSESQESERTQEEEEEGAKDEKLGLNQENNTETGSSPISVKTRKNSIPPRHSSTPKPESAGTQMSDLFSITTDGSSAGPENNDQTYLLSTSKSQSSSLTNEEIGKRFQDLSFAFKTDSMTIQKRLLLMKRKRDQAETNIENELKTIKSKLKSLQYLGLNSEFVNLMSDLKKQLDFVLNATVQLSSSAEGYGYAQHEERLLEFVTVMLQHVENVETLKNDASKILEKLKIEGKRSQAASISLDSDGEEDRIIRRRSVSAMAIEGPSRRRASIATLPRIASSISESGSEKGAQWMLSSRPLGGVAKKLSFSQVSPSRAHEEEGRRDSTGSRHRTEGWTSENLMKNIEEFPEQRSSTMESETPEESLDADSNNLDVVDSSLHLRQLFESLEEMRQNSISQESFNAIHCLRRIIEWNKLLISATRFRWPDNVLHYVPFYLTWYVVFVLALVFVGGLFTGINGCYTYSCLKYSLLWFAALTMLSLTRRFYRFILPLLFAFLLALVLLFIWLTEILLPQLSNEETDKLFRKLGFALEIRYPLGPPPV